MPHVVTISLEKAQSLCIQAAISAGASEAVAKSLSFATVAAEARGQTTVGILHFFDYLDAIKDGRLNGIASPKFSYPTKAAVVADADGGIAQLGFDLSLEKLVNITKDIGVSIFTQANAYTCGALGFYAEQLAVRGFIAFGFGNSPALMAAGGAKQRIYGTNPFTFAAPQVDKKVLLVDQASSATAYVNIRAAAEEGKALPEGWAIDSEGQPTIDPMKALKGSLLAFGGPKGGNIALMVEVMSTLSGANWSIDAPSFLEGNESPRVGMTVIAIEPSLINEHFTQRLSDHLSTLSTTFGVYIPGAEKSSKLAESMANGINIDSEIYARLSNIKLSN
ncbi:Ldh family oxidoreductase [Leeia sp. TBRC 13508]|uniref:Ldh family oxidoreductase n=1 Tax=Leeia speluncae TaxID=2884804 RepID=A0ABS8D9U7_9NEIS|nr:Ldh family oxidoreductase [Leeia speluncae]MCB6184975.1 Ldh family oxidoreductase [Leeia speluncae]